MKQHDCSATNVSRVRRRFADWLDNVRADVAADMNAVLRAEIEALREGLCALADDCEAWWHCGVAPEDAALFGLEKHDPDCPVCPEVRRARVILEGHDVRHVDDLRRALAGAEQRIGTLETALRELLGDLDLRAELHCQMHDDPEVVVPVSASILDRARAVLTATPGADRLTAEERGRVENVRLQLKSGLGMVYPSSWDGWHMMEVIDRLAPRPVTPGEREIRVHNCDGPNDDRR